MLKLCDKQPPKFIYTIPSFHNPTGITMPSKRRLELINIARSCGSVIIEDDLWSELSYECKHPDPIKCMDDDGHVIYIKGFSKFLHPGCRIGITVSSGPIMEKLVACKANTDLGTPMVTQRLILPLLQRTFIDKYITRLIPVISSKCDLTLRLLQQYMPRGVKWTRPKGGTNIWISLPGFIDTDVILEEALRYNITFLPGAACFPGLAEHNHMRISFAYLMDKELEYAIITLCKIISDKLETK